VNGEKRSIRTRPRARFICARHGASADAALRNSPATRRLRISVLDGRTAQEQHSIGEFEVKNLLIP